MDRDTFAAYVLNPRMDDEVLQKYREKILGTLSEDDKLSMKENPVNIWRWIEGWIVSVSEQERSSVITTPAGCLNTGTGSFLSKKILFVAIARTLGIAARLNPNDRSMEYRKDGMFVSVLAETAKNSLLVLKACEGVQWKYFQNWSIAKLKDGKYTSLKLEAEAFEEQEMKLALESGSYRILVSNRLPNGNIFAGEYCFEIQPGETKRVELMFRNADLEDMLENISLPEFTLKKVDGITVAASELTADGKHILLFLEEEKEPTEHILNEILEQADAFAEYAKQMSFVVRSKKALETSTLSKTLGRLKNVQVLYDDFSEIINILGRRMYVDPDKLPLIIVTDGSLNGIYAASGYNVGTGDMLLRLMQI